MAMRWVTRLVVIVVETLKIRGIVMEKNEAIRRNRSGTTRESPKS